jgi:hypothetical protein
LWAHAKERDFEALDRALAALAGAGHAGGVRRRPGRGARAARQPPATGGRLLIPAAAAERGFGVLHLDARYDTLATVLAFVSVRLDAA